jgi:hypothetical protein
MTIETTGAKQSAGARLYIGGTGALDSEPSFVEVGEITNYGAFGRTYQKVTHNPVNNRKTFKFKGARDDGSLQLKAARVPNDAGQAALRAALDATDSSADAYNFKIVLDDANGSPPTASTFKFQALVMSYTIELGGVNNMVETTINVEINGDIEETEAGV